MSNFVYKLFYLIIGLCWSSIFLARALVELIRVGPKKMFHKLDNNIRPAKLQDPVYGEHKTALIDKVKLHYVISGPEQAPLMLMIHGFPEIWYSWRYQIREFQKDFRVVAVDMRGFGESDKPKGVENYKMDILVRDVQKLIESLGYKSCVLLSHDWGGAVAWAFASVYPEMVDRLVVMNIPPVMIWKHGFTSIWNPLQFLASGYIYLFNLPYLPEFLTGLHDAKILADSLQSKPLGVRSGLMTADDVECYKYYFRKPGAFTPGLNYYRANLGVGLYHHDLDYPMPVQIIWGCEDIAITMSLLDETLRSIPKARVAKIPEASHWVQMDQPGKVCTIIRDFLSETGYVSSK